MKYALSFLLCVTIICRAFPASAIDDDNGIVRVYGILSPNNALSGTGFFIKLHGHPYVCTAYHVISGAKTIQLKCADGDLMNVSVAGYDERKDIALLNYSTTKKISHIQFFNLISTLPEHLTDLPAHIVGHPKTLTYSHFNVGFTNNQYISSSQIDVFKLDLNINLIGITGTIYDGDSGAPVITSNGVVAFVSGSYNEGGTIFWAIPASYITQISILNSPVVNLSYLPALNMLRGHVNGLTRNFRINAGVQNNYNSFITINSTFKKDNQEYQSTLNDVLQTCSDFRQALNDCDTYEKFSVQLNAFFEKYKPLEARVDDYQSKNHQDIASWKSAFSYIKNNIDKPEYSKFLQSNGSFINSRYEKIDGELSENLTQNDKIQSEGADITAKLKVDGQNNDYASLWKDAYKWIDNITTGHRYLKNSLLLQNEMIQLVEVLENAMAESQTFE